MMSPWTETWKARVASAMGNQKFGPLVISRCHWPTSEASHRLINWSTRSPSGSAHREAWPLLAKPARECRDEGRGFEHRARSEAIEDPASGPTAECNSDGGDLRAAPKELIDVRLPRTANEVLPAQRYSCSVKWLNWNPAGVSMTIPARQLDLAEPSVGPASWGDRTPARCP